MSGTDNCKPRRTSEHKPQTMQANACLPLIGFIVIAMGVSCWAAPVPEVRQPTDEPRPAISSKAHDDAEPAYGQEVVAVVGGRFISRHDVEHSWRTAYERVEGLARRHQLSPDQRLERLQLDWRQAINRLVQERLILQEADRERQQLIDRYAFQLASRSDVTPAMARMEIEQQFRAFEDRQFARWRDEAVDEAGGWPKLRGQLQRQGQTRAEWEQQLRDQFVVRVFLQQRVGSVNVSPREIRAYYAEHRDNYTKPLEFRFREILLRPEKFQSEANFRQVAEAVARSFVQPTGPEAFSGLAAQISHAPSRRRGGLVVIGGKQFIPTGVHDEAVDAALLKLKAGQVAGPIATRHGTYFIMLEERRGSGLQALADVQQEIERELRAERLLAKRRELFNVLRKRAKVEVRNDRLPEKFHHAFRDDSEHE